MTTASPAAACRPRPGTASCRWRTRAPHIPPDPGPAAASQPDGRAAAPRRAASAPTRAWRRRRSRRATQKKIEPHARPDAGRAEAAGRQPCAGPPGCSRRRPAPPSGSAGAASGRARRTEGRSRPSRRRSPRLPCPSGAPTCQARRAPAALTACDGGQRSLSLIANILINLVVFAVLAVGGGLGTAWYMIEAGSRLSTRTLRPVDHLDRGRPARRRSLHARAYRAQRAAAAVLDARAHLSGQGRQPRRAAALGLRIRHRHGGPRRRPGGASPPSTARAA